MLGVNAKINIIQTNITPLSLELAERSMDLK